MKLLGKDAQAETTSVWGPRVRGHGSSGMFCEQGIVFAGRIDKVKPKEGVDKSWATDSWVVVRVATGHREFQVMTESEFGRRYKELRDARDTRDSPHIQDALPVGKRVTLGSSPPLSQALLDELRGEGFMAFEPRQDYLVWAIQVSEDEVRREFPNGVMQTSSGEVSILPADFLIMPCMGGDAPVSRVPRKIFLETYIKSEEPRNT